jgi:hypothetical protein
MKLVTRLIGTSFIAAILAATAIFAQDINTDYDHNYKFNILKGYSWGKVQASDPLVEPRLAAAVDHVLQGYGFKESAKSGDAAVEQSKPTVMIVTAVEAKNPEQYVAFYRDMNNLDWHRGWQGGGFSDSAANLRQIHGGTLIIDIYDGATGKLIWRGTAAEGIARNEKTNQDNVDKSVALLFAKFPPKSGGPMVPNQQEVPPSPSSQPLNAPN